MGILNITPDSFSDGNQYNNITQAVERATLMQQAGVDIIDIGGESTRPGAATVTANQEIDRVVPIIESVVKLGIKISVDTSKASVMSAAIKAGAGMINDVRALQQPNALQTAAKLGVPICLMHMQGQPKSMQKQPQYNNVIQQVMSFLTHRVESCISAGIDKQLICVDPGFGFGKSLPHNIELLNGLAQIAELGLPLLVGLSRKSMLGQITGQAVDKRLAGSLAVALIAMQKGARIIRVHDVEQSHDIRQVFMALNAKN